MEWRSITCTVLLTTLAMSLGCDPPKLEPLPPLEREDSAENDQPEEVQVVASPAQTWAKEKQLPSEIWYIQYENGVRIGYFRTLVSKPDRLIRIAQTGRYRFRPDPTKRQVVQNTFELESLEYPDGRIASFKEKNVLGEVSSEIKGQLSGELMRVTTTDPSGTKKSNVKWEGGTWGMLGIQSMLLANPMKPGERRSCKFFLHKLVPPQIVPAELIAGEPTITTVAGGRTEELIPIETAMRAGEQVSYSTNYVNQSGVIYKTVAGKVSTYFAPKDIALSIANEMELESKLARSAKFYGELPAPDLKSATYMIEGSKIDLYAMWDKKTYQRVKSVSALSSQVTVLDATDSDAVSTLTPAAPDEDCLASSPLLTVKHSYIEQLAADWFGETASAEDSEEDRVSRVLKLSEKLATEIQSQPVTAELASAIATARKRKGNNNARAILLTTLLRNRQIPSRLAVGFKVDPENSRMRFYLWSEFWTGTRWLPIDASEGTFTGADCLKMSDTTLTDGNPYRSILPVYDAMELINVRRIR